MAPCSLFYTSCYYLKFQQKSQRAYKISLMECIYSNQQPANHHRLATQHPEEAGDFTYVWRAAYNPRLVAVPHNPEKITFILHMIILGRSVSFPFSVLCPGISPPQQEQKPRRFSSTSLSSSAVLVTSESNKLFNISYFVLSEDHLFL